MVGGRGIKRHLVDKEVNDIVYDRLPVNAAPVALSVEVTALVRVSVRQRRDF